MKLAAADGEFESASCDVVKAASAPRQMEAARTARTLIIIHSTPGPAPRRQRLRSQPIAS